MVAGQRTGHCRDGTLTVVGWALVEAAGYSFVEGSHKEEDCVLLQCREKNQLCVARCVYLCVSVY